MGRTPCTIGLICLCAAISTPIRAEIRYRVVDLGGGYSSTPRDINQQGQVVGHLGTVVPWPMGVVWPAAQQPFTRLPTLGGADYSVARSINDSGVIVGRMQAGKNSDFYYAVRYINGQPGALPLPETAFFSEAMAINNAGIVVGYVNANTTTPAFMSNGILQQGNQAVIWGASGAGMQYLSIAGENQSVAFGINSSNQVIAISEPASGGTRAILWNNGAPTDLGNLGGSRAYPTAINDLGQVVGYSYLPGGLGLHGFLWQDGQIADIGSLYLFTQPLAINNHGQIVGSSQSSPELRTAVIWENGKPIDLNTLIEPLTNGYNKGMVLREAWAINDQGVIAVMGQTPAPFGADRAYLLIPIPEPASASVLAIAAAALLSRRKNR